jgi:hypothetical protein
MLVPPQDFNDGIEAMEGWSFGSLRPIVMFKLLRLRGSL